jgi:RNA polymerase sigma-70 factor, ECF subfamily
MQENKHISDEELYQRVKSDDARALKTLFERYFSALCRFAVRFVKQPHLAEEVVSDVFLNIWIKKEKVEIKINLKTYLYTAVRNQSLNYVKKNKIHVEDIETAVRENITSDLTADAFITTEELTGSVNELLQRLPEKRQIIFKMNRIDGLRYHEIAEVLSISIHTVQNQMVAAVKFLSDRHSRNK